MNQETEKKLKRIRKRLRKYFPAVAVFAKVMGLLFSKRSFLRKSGYIRSIAEKRPCKQDGSPIAWMNYSAIAFLEERLNEDLSLFEYGSGNSTLFFSRLVGSVISVEVERDWYNYLIGQVPKNVKLILCDPYNNETYPRLIAAQSKKFDVVVVDANDRVACMIHAVHSLSDQGVIILDDSHGEIHKPGIIHLLQQGFRKLDFEGLKPGSLRAYRTTIFYRDGNCLGI